MVEEVCRKAGISQQTYYKWPKKHGGLMPSEMRRLKRLEGENQHLKRLVADLAYIAILNGFVYLAAIMDEWSRRIVSYALGRWIDAKLTRILDFDNLRQFHSAL